MLKNLRVGSCESQHVDHAYLSVCQTFSCTDTVLSIHIPHGKCNCNKCITCWFIFYFHLVSAPQPSSEQMVWIQRMTKNSAWIICCPKYNEYTTPFLEEEEKTTLLNGSLSNNALDTVLITNCGLILILQNFKRTEHMTKKCSTGAAISVALSCSLFHQCLHWSASQEHLTHCTWTKN